MNRTVLTFLTILCLSSTALLMGTKISVKGSPDVIHVPEDYEKIQWAIGNATIGATILVGTGTYYEHLVVDKSISLIGQEMENTVIDGNRIQSVVRITSDNVTIMNFTVRNSGWDWITSDSGVFVDRFVNGCNLSHNTLSNNHIGVFALQSSDIILSGNTILNNNNGVWLEGSGKNTLVENTVLNNWVKGIYLVYTDNNTLARNIVSNNYNGIILGGTSNNTLICNNITHNVENFGVMGFSPSTFIHNIDTSNLVDGKRIYYLINQRDVFIDPTTFPDVGYLAVVNSTNVSIRNLNLTDNFQGLLLAYTINSFVEGLKVKDNERGIDLSESDSNTIAGNEISNNYRGFSLLNSNDNTLSGNTIIYNVQGIDSFRSIENTIAVNTISNNDLGIDLYESYDNLIHQNNFINNTHQANIDTPGYPNFWDNGYPYGNYWSDYTGVDLCSGPYQNETGNDGIGDAPYAVDANNRDNYPLMNPIPIYHFQLFRNYVGLLMDYKRLNFTYYELLDADNRLTFQLQNLNLTYYTLLSNFTELQRDCDSLQKIYNDLQDSYDELQSDQEAIINELGIIRNSMHIFIATTVIFLATTVYFAIRKPKMMPKTKTKKKS